MTSPTHSRWLIVGCGYVGTALATQRVSLGAGHTVVGVRRSPSPAPQPFACIAADCTDVAFARHLPPGDFDVVVMCAAAKQSDAAAYERTYVHGAQGVVRALRTHQKNPARFIFVSSTAVYEADDGRWVDATTPVAPTDYRGSTMLRAEQVFAQSGWPAVMLRLGGIYGPGRVSFLERVRRGEARLPDVPTYTNRIHRDDCAGALAHVAQLDNPAPVYVGVDDAPAERGEVIRGLAQILQVAQPPAVAATPGAAARGKRCSNALLRASGFDFTYPTWREGYQSLLGETA